MASAGADGHGDANAAAHASRHRCRRRFQAMSHRRHEAFPILAPAQIPSLSNDTIAIRCAHQDTSAARQNDVARISRHARVISIASISAAKMLGSVAIIVSRRRRADLLGIFGPFAWIAVDK